MTLEAAELLVHLINFRTIQSKGGGTQALNISSKPNYVTGENATDGIR